MDTPPDTPTERPEGMTRAEVMATLGISKSTLLRREKAGEITVIGEDEKGRVLYDREEVEAQVGATNEVNRVVMSASEFMSGATSMLAQAQSHLESMHTNLTGPQQKIVDTLMETIRQLQSEVDKLRKKNFKMLEVYENSLTLQHERELARRKAEQESEQSQRNWEFMTGLLKDTAPILLEQVFGNRGLQPVMELLARITPDQLEAMSSLGFVTPEQAAQVREFQQRLPKEKLLAAQKETLDFFKGQEGGESPEEGDKSPEEGAS